MKNIYILDESYNIIMTLSNDLEESLPIISDFYQRSLDTNMKEVFLTVDGSNKLSGDIETGMFILYPINENEYAGFKIVSITEESDGYTPKKEIKAISADNIDLLKGLVNPTEFTLVSLTQILEHILIDSSFFVGNTDYDELINFKIDNHITKLQALIDLCNQVGLEFEVVHDMRGNTIIKRSINVLKNIGSDLGKIFIRDFDLLSIKRDKNIEKLVTAMKGFGATTAEGAKLSFKDLKDPILPPGYKFLNGSDYIVSEAAFEEYSKDGNHLWGVLEDSEAKDATALFNNTLKILQEYDKPKYTYEASVLNMNGLIGEGFIPYSEGDRISIQDKTLFPELYLSARIREISTSITKPQEGVITFGDYIALAPKRSDAVDRLQNIINNNEAAWEADSYALRIHASNGQFFKNNEGETELTALLIKGSVDTDTAGTKYKYKWTIRDSKGNPINFPDGTTSKEGKKLLVKGTDIQTSLIYKVVSDVKVSNSMITLDAEATIVNIDEASTTYTWVKYADDDLGNGMSDNPEGKVYLGLSYNNLTPIESTSPSNYQWIKVLGNDGIPGPPGSDTYTWIMYSLYSNGDQMQKDPVGMKYLGIAYNKKSPNPSTNPADYAWSQFRGNDGINGKPGTDGAPGEDGISPIDANISSSQGSFFKQGIGRTTLSVKVIQGTLDITNDCTYAWTKTDNDTDTPNPSWSKTGNNITITSDDVVAKSVFTVTVSYKNLRTTAQYTISDLYDMNPSIVPPANPQEGQVWLDISKDPPVLMVYANGKWQPSSKDWTDQIKEITDGMVVIKNDVTTVKSDITNLNNQIKLTVSQDQLASTVTVINGDIDKVNNKVDNIQIGGSQLLLNSALLVDTSHWQLAVNVTRDTAKVLSGRYSLKSDQSGLTSNSWRGFGQIYMPAKEGDTFTASIYTLVENRDLIDQGTFMEIRYWDNSGSRITQISAGITPSKNNTWERFSVTGTCPKDTARVEFVAYVTRNGVCWFNGMKLETGNKVTDWDKAPQDTSAEIDNAKNEMVIYTDKKIIDAKAEIQVSINQINLKINQNETNIQQVVKDLGALTLDTYNLLDYSSFKPGTQDLAIRNWELANTSSRAFGAINSDHIEPSQVFLLNEFYMNAQLASGQSWLEVRNKIIPVVIGEKYTISAWVYQQSGSSRSYIRVIQSDTESLLDPLAEKSEDATKDGKFELLIHTFTASKKYARFDFISGRPLASFAHPMFSQASRYVPWQPSPVEMGDRIETNKQNIAQIKIDVGAITTTVSKLQETVTQVGGEVTSLTQRMQTAEQKITPDAITNTVTNSEKYKNDIGGIDSRLDKAEQKITPEAIINSVSTGLTEGNIIHGTATELNKDNFVVRSLLTKEKIVMEGTELTTYNSAGIPCLSLKNQNLILYDWSDASKGQVAQFAAIKTPTEIGSALIIEPSAQRIAIGCRVTAGGNDVENITIWRYKSGAQHVGPFFEFYSNDVRCRKINAYNTNLGVSVANVYMEANTLSPNEPSWMWFNRYFSDRAVFLSGRSGVCGIVRAAKWETQDNTRIASPRGNNFAVMGCAQTKETVTDIGHGKIGSNGEAIIMFDQQYLDFVDTFADYFIGYDVLGEERVYSLEKAERYFKVGGKPGTEFSYKVECNKTGHNARRFRGMESSKFEYDTEPLKPIEEFKSELISKNDRNQAIDKLDSMSLEKQDKNGSFMDSLQQNNKAHEMLGILQNMRRN